MSNVQREEWIDVAKAFAIFAVLIDHTYGVLYKDYVIHNPSYFSVSLFILCMWVTSYLSNKRTKWNYKVLAKKIIGILIPYSMASAIYSIVEYKCFNLQLYLTSWIHFNASPPLYYVLLYIGLLIVAPVFLYLLQSEYKGFGGMLYNFVVFAIIVLFSAVCTKRTNILEIYGGGGVMFGGSYMILLYLGMLFAKYFAEVEVTNVFVDMFLFSLFILWSSFININQFKIDSYFPFGSGINPPSITLFCGALIMLAIAWTFKGVQKSSRAVIRKIHDCLSYIGRHTLYIFLYHFLFLLKVVPVITDNLLSLNFNKWIVRFIGFAVLIIGPLFIEFIFSHLKRMVRNAYI